VPDEHRDFDQAIKHMLLVANQAIFDLAGLSEIVWESELDSELASPRRQADLVWRILYHLLPAIAHIEVQIEPEDDMALRIAEYGTRIYFREHLPVLSIVLYLKPTGNLPRSPFVVTLPNGDHSFSYSFIVIPLWEIEPERILATPFTDLWPLAVLMQGSSQELAVRVAQQIAAAPLPMAERERLEGLLILLAGLRLPVAPLAQLLQEDKMLKDIFQHSSLRELLMQEVDPEKVKASHDEGFNEGIQKGVEQGIEQGVQLGQVQAMRNVITQLAQQRFPALSADTRSFIAQYDDVARMQDAVLAMATFADEAALVAFLNQATDGRESSAS
jgi:hypothetical protein